ncbi:hypothetical protein L9F63_015225 [Diploptera punctata]|uniref:FAT domain-containing protein n=1 Tax=Diploptera punctata TaxID=6984 RepID=A0AAD8A683_DIPPU|nr:hypothetical protein L9F63_015225 [Diploptera punctata]
MLLEASTDTPDYKEKIFLTPLSKCEFEDFKMIVSWRAQHATAVPMFADTLASQISQSQSLSSSTSLIRATQNTLAFKPTLAQDTASLNVSSTLLFSIGSSGSTQRRSIKMAPEFRTKTSEPTDEVDAPKTFVPNLRRRFTQDENQKRNLYAGLQIQRNVKQEQLEKERGRRREANIDLLRSYRSGDFPDIEILHSAVIKPLQELAKRVPTVARELFVLVFDSLLNELSGDERDDFTNRAGEAINSILSQNKEECSPVLIGALMQVALHNCKHLSLDPDYVASASQVSGLFALGSLVLEETLIHRDVSTDAGPSKRSRGSETGHDELWALLIELYSSMDEWDVVHGIFHSYLDCGDDVKEAIKWEASGNWSKAKKMYAKSLSEMESDNLLGDHCYEAFYKCLAHLSDWKELNTQIKQQVESNLDQLWDEWYQVKLLPQFVLSEVHLMLDNGIDGDDRAVFINKVNEWLSDKDKSSYMTNCMSEEVAMIHLLQDKVARSSQQVDHTLNAFLNSWADLDPFSRKLRTRQLLDLQKTADIQAYLSFCTLSNDSNSAWMSKELFRRWNNTLPLPADSLLLWDARSMYRRKFAQQIDNDEAEESVTCTQLAVIDSAICQNNFSVARKYLIQTKHKCDRNDDEFKLDWNLRFLKAKWLEMQLKEDINKQFEMKLKCWDLLESRLEQTEVMKFPEIYVKKLQFLCSITTGIMQQIDDQSEVLDKVDGKMLQQLVERIEATDSRKESLVDSLKMYSLRSLKETVDQENRNQNASSIAQAYLQVAKYCRAYCKTTISESDYGTEIITSVLRAMKYGSWEAQQLFPCILQLPDLRSQSDLFHSESCSVPVWMFLGWINQLLASLNTEVGPVLYDLVRSLARTYPQAIVYGFQVSQENYTLGTEQPTLNNFIHELAQLLYHTPILDTFLRAFSCLGQPCLMLWYFVEKLKKMVEEPSPNLKSLTFMYDVMMREVFSARVDTRIHGKVFNETEKFRKMLQKLENKIKEGNKSVLKDLKTLMETLIPMKDRIRPPIQIKDYSPWLSEFQGNMELEIPGQYTGESRPMPQHHIKIVGFKQTVSMIITIPS